MNQLVETKPQSSALSTMTEADLTKVLQSSLYPGAGIESIKMVLGYCKASGLDPMMKPVHIVPMWDNKSQGMRDVIMPGIGMYRTQAARSGCAGVTEPDFGPDITKNIGGQEITFPIWCKVTVKRRLTTGEVVDFTAKEIWMENYAVRGGKERSIAPNAMWTKRPYGQIAKCAEAQALRKAFPEIGSEPTADEMAGKTLNEFAGETIDGSTGEIIKKSAAPTSPTWPNESFDKQVARWTKAVAEGLKTTDEIMTMARSKGDLTSSQEAQIKAMNKAEAQPKADEPAATDSDLHRED